MIIFDSKVVYYYVTYKIFCFEELMFSSLIQGSAGLVIPVRFTFYQNRHRNGDQAEYCLTKNIEVRKIRW